MKKLINSEKLKILLLILFGITFLFETPYEPDFGWHYKYGEYFFQNGKILKENIFSYTMPDYEWVSSYWIAQIMIYTSHHFLGNAIPTILSSSLFCVLLYFSLKKNSKDLFSIFFVFILTVVSLKTFAITIRPLYFSTIYLLLLMKILIKKDGTNVAIPIIFLLWANTHADFLLGLFILGIYCLSNFLTITSAPNLNIKKFISPFKNKEYLSLYFKSFIKYLNQLLKRSDLGTLILKNFWVLIVSTAITLINPYGIKLWLVLFKELNQPFRAFVREWMPPQNINFLSIVSNILVSMSLIFSFKPYKNLGEKNVWNRFIIVFFYILSIKSVYFLRITAIVSLFLLLRNIELIKKDVYPILRKKFKFMPSFTLTTSLIFLCSFGSYTFVNNLFLSLNLKEWSIKKSYPYNAVSYIRENSLQGNMFNNYDWGGYLIWQLPEHKTFIDGRMTAWKKGTKYLMEDYKKISLATNKNVELLDEYLKYYDIKLILNKPDSKIVKYLKENRPEEWEVIFEDDISVILKKTDEI